MRHVTKYCNVMVPHCTVRRDTACIRSSPDPSLLFRKWVGHCCREILNGEQIFHTHSEKHALGVFTEKSVPGGMSLWGGGGDS